MAYITLVLYVHMGSSEALCELITADATLEIQLPSNCCHIEQGLEI